MQISIWRLSTQDQNTNEVSILSNTHELITQQIQIALKTLLTSIYVRSAFYIPEKVGWIKARHWEESFKTLKTRKAVVGPQNKIIQSFYHSIILITNILTGISIWPVLSVNIQYSAVTNVSVIAKVMEKYTKIIP